MATKKFGRVSALGAMATLLLSVFAVRVSAGPERAEAVVKDQAGNVLGSIDFVKQNDGALKIEAKISGLPQGFHGFHVHQVGTCTAPFTSAGGHYAGAGTTHGAHDGDLPSLYASAATVTRAEFETDALTLEEVVGRAVIIHAGRDNFANIPARYHSHTTEDVLGPDSATNGTGDAGSRFACGPIKAS